ncbi:MAG: peroxiredoxin [Methanoregula sp.]|nr:peroxiredoxin [Methanoregula sp.]
MPIRLLTGMALTTDSFTGKTAPAFCLPDAQGTQVCLEQFRNRWVVLYFYPRDNTPGCTLEAMQFNAALEKFAELGALVIGVSTDSQESHQKFAEKRNLNILLLSDTEHTALSAYDSWKPKTMFGREFFGTQRDTFLIDPSGIIVAVWRKVSVKGHAEEVKAVLLEKQKGDGK